MSPLERKPDAGDSHVRFDERGVETQCRAGYSGTGNRKGRSPLRPGLNITAPLLDSTCAVTKAHFNGLLLKPEVQTLRVPGCPRAGVVNTVALRHELVYFAASLKTDKR